MKSGGWRSRNHKGREQWEELGSSGLEQSSDWAHGGKQSQGQERRWLLMKGKGVYPVPSNLSLTCFAWKNCTGGNAESEAANQLGNVWSRENWEVWMVFNYQKLLQKGRKQAKHNMQQWNLDYLLVTALNVRIGKWCCRTAGRPWDVHHLGFLGHVYTVPEKALM